MRMVLQTRDHRGAGMDIEEPDEDDDLVVYSVMDDGFRSEVASFMDEDAAVVHDLCAEVKYLRDLLRRSSSLGYVGKDRALIDEIKRALK